MSIWNPEPSLFIELISKPLSNFDNRTDTTVQTNDFLCNLSDSERSDLISKSKVRLAKFGCFSTVAIIDSCSRQIEKLCNMDRLGVVTTAGPLNLEVAWEFGLRQLNEGPHLINPVAFPNTIVSSVATTLASMLNAKCFAMAIGADQFAFLEALERAATLTQYNHSAATFLATACDASNIHKKAALSIGAKISDFAAGFIISSDSSVCNGRQIQTIIDTYDSPTVVQDLLGIDPASCFNVFYEQNCFERSTYKTSLAHKDVLTATGAVILIEAMMSESTSPLLAGVSQDGHYRGVVLV